ncbi:MAG: helicase-related protein [Pseudomonadota bacterium]
MPRDPDSRVLALLGPTNTGKTHYAIERMVSHPSGIIGFPLRLLARENYDRLVALKGAHQVALVTGEEKILPPGARYYCCTVESMPLERPVDFVAVDEIQLAGDPERGHIFTDRMLHSRGLSETILLGAETVRPLLRKLVPGAEFITRERYSTLRYAGYSKLTRLPTRSAIVAFSAGQVYALAEQLRRQRGGTAVVLGALSPRTRNAQVALFESGEVDYLVATDAIGMGLNLSLDHVAFAGLSKFDGRRMRRLSPSEVGQIAGRAGRHMRDGTFGTTAELEGVPAEVVEAVEEHRFLSLRRLYWRSRVLDFSSPRSLIASLKQAPPDPDLQRVRGAEDQAVLSILAEDPEVQARATSPAAVALLWEVCQIPDFSKTMTGQHVSLLTQVFRHLSDGEGLLPDGWVAGQLRRIDRPTGDIDTLTQRLAQVRTWTYITHRADWLRDATSWQEQTRGIEDRLSDALHESLTERFVDRRAALFARRQAGGETMLAAVKRDGRVVLEGHAVGRLKGFSFKLDPEITGADARQALSAVRKALAQEMPRRVAQVESDADSAFKLEENGRISWRGAVLGRLVAGPLIIQPEVEVMSSEFLDGAQRERLRRRLSAWLQGFLHRRLAPLFRLRESALAPQPRGVAFQLVEALGCLPRRGVDGLSRLTKAENKALAALGVKLGQESLFLPALLNPRAQSLLLQLWRLAHPGQAFEPPAEAVQTVALTERDSAGAYAACGYRLLLKRRSALAVSIQTLEQIAGLSAKLARQSGAFAPSAPLLALAAGDEALLGQILGAIGYQREENGGVVSYRRRGPGKARRSGPAPTAKKAPRKAQPREDSPFALLSGLKVAMRQSG